MRSLQNGEDKKLNLEVVLNKDIDKNLFKKQ